MKCFIRECNNSWRKGKKLPNITFHKFPKKSYKEWLECLGVFSNIPWPKHFKICSIHFADDCFIRTGLNVRLRPNSKPTLNIPQKKLLEEQAYESESTLTLSSPEQLCPSHSEETNSPKILNKKRKLKRLFQNSSPTKSSSSTDSSTIRKRAKLVETFHNYSSSLQVLEGKNLKSKCQLKKFRAKYHNRKVTVQRLKRKVQSLHSIVNTLKKKQLISEMASEHLSQTFSSVPREIMARILKNQRNNSISKSKFSPELRDFAMTLLFYSRKAYNFVRKSLDLCLPHPATIRKIYSGIECKPGFTGSSFEVLKRKSSEYNSLNKTLACSLIIDEMAIKKQIVFDGKKTYGYVNIGCENVDDLTNPATEALVFLVVCHTEHWKLPIAYFLIKSLNGSEKANLVNEALIRLANSNVKITSITCDGPSANISMLKNLGCILNNTETDKTYFNHPLNNDKIFAILDPCHMLKLMRNMLGELGSFYDDEHKLVEWKYIDLLYKIQENEGLSAGNRLRKAHMEWCRQKMKVKLAAQTLSSSVADAIQYLKEMNLLEFQESAPTIRFIRIVDRLFDILNSRCPVARGYKAPLRESNESLWKPFVLQAISYFRKCRNANGILMTSTPRKTPFIGFIISLTSTIGIFDEFVKTNVLNYILTYKFSQDHLELFFCSVRCRNGWNNNPNALQMEQTYKKLLYHAQVKGIGGNCNVLDSTTILSLQSRSTVNVLDSYDIDYSIARKYNIDIPSSISEGDHDYNVDYSPSLTEYKENVIAYISGYVIRMIKKRIKCPECIDALQNSSKSTDSTYLKLLGQKDRGGLLWPSEGLTAICIKCEEQIRRLLCLTGNKVPKEEVYIITLANLVSQFYYNQNIFPDLKEHFFDYEFGSNHVYLLIKTVCLCYIKIRFYNLCKKQTEYIEGSKIRQTLNKLILFNHQ